jgi:hypothetical protein
MLALRTGTSTSAVRLAIFVLAREEKQHVQQRCHSCLITKLSKIVERLMSLSRAHTLELPTRGRPITRLANGQRPTRKPYIGLSSQPLTTRVASPPMRALRLCSFGGIANYNGLRGPCQMLGQDRFYRCLCSRQGLIRAIFSGQQRSPSRGKNTEFSRFELGAGERDRLRIDRCGIGFCTGRCFAGLGQKHLCRFGGC